MPSTIDIAIADIPVIDVSCRNERAASQLFAAAANNGFVFIENNDAGIAVDDIDGMFNLSHDFFDSPVSVKEECSINSAKSGKNHGWLSMHTETLDPGNQKRGDFKEAFNIGEYQQNAPQQPLPAILQAQSARIGAFQSSCHALCKRILQLFALALSIEQDWFARRHDQALGPSGSVLRLLYYPSPKGLSPDVHDIRAGAHSDYGSVTLLFQLPGQPGLEIQTPDGTWAAVPVNPQGRDLVQGSVRNLPVLVNIGDLLAYWTNGLLKSTVHRVIFPQNARDSGEDRYSIAYFCHPMDEAELVPVPSEVVKQHGKDGGRVADGKVLTARDHLNERLAATYGLKKE